MAKKTTTITAKFYVPPKIKYPAEQLKRGMKVESEHTPDKRVQKIIAKVQIAENKNMYKSKIKNK